MTTIEQEKAGALLKAVDSLARFKFIMFGYHAAMWVTLNRLDRHRERNPFRPFVDLARLIRAAQVNSQLTLLSLSRKKGAPK